MGLLKGMIGIVAMAPLAGAALSGIGGVAMSGLGGATQALVSAGFLGHAVKATGVNKIFKM